MLSPSGTAWSGGHRRFLPSLSPAGGGPAPGGAADAAAASEGLQRLSSAASAGAWALETAGSGWSIASSARTWSPQVEARLRKAAGREFHTLRPGDLQRSQELKLELQQLKLSDYFDDRGSPRFKRLGISFAAKQHDEIKDTFGSRTLGDLSTFGSRGRFSARAAHRAIEAIEKDTLNVKNRTGQLLCQLSSMDRHLVKDVRERQLEMLFCEVPGFSDHIPPNVQLADLLPADVNKEEEFKERRSAERWNGHFTDKFWIEGAKMGWLLERNQTLLTNEALALWARASRGRSCPFGMDRPTFCRFLIDCKLVDQQKVPYFWAVSLFDSVSKPMHVCPPDATWAMTAPAAYIVHRWTLMTVLDAVLRQHYDDKCYGGFSCKLVRAIRQCLPAEVKADAWKEALEPASSLLREQDDEAPGSPAPPSDACSALEDLVMSAESLSMPGSGVGEGAPSPAVPAVPAVPSWLRPPERPASSLNTRLEKRLRDRLIQWMLVEPEVLNVVAQHFQLLSKLHGCYSDAEGHMDFSSLLQFCTDFCLVPELVASEFLKGVYETVQCLDCSTTVHESKTVSQKASSSSPERAAGLPQSSLQVPRRARQAKAPTPSPGAPASSPVEGPAADASAAEPRASEALPGVFGPGAFVEALCRAAFVYLGFYGNVVQQSTGGYARVVWLVAYLRRVFMRLGESLERRRRAGARVAERPLTRALQAVTLEDWERPAGPSLAAARVAHPLPGLGVRKTKRRKVCGHPVRLKPTLTTVNMVKAQLASSAKPTFLKQFTRQISQAKSAGEDEDESPGAISTTSSDEDSGELPQTSPTNPEVATPRFTLGRKSRVVQPSQPKPMAAVEEELWALEDLMTVEAGQPSIIEGMCTLCGSHVEKFPWGNPRCRGCSAIDALAFDSHPFKQLLTDKQRDIRMLRPKAKLHPGSIQRRDDLTPPPVDAEARETFRTYHIVTQPQSARS